MKLSSKAQAAFDTVIEKFKTGDLSPIVRIARIPHNPDSDVPWDRWAASNRVATMMMSGGSTDLRGYRQWQKMGRQVVKGARAAYILVPMISKYMAEDTEGNEVEHTRMRGFRTVAVFAVEDTKGDALPDRGYIPQEPPPLADLAESVGITVSYDARGSMGSCTVDGKTGRLATHEHEVCWHEPGHAMHAKI